MAIDELQLAKMIFISRKKQGIPVDNGIIIKELERILDEEEHE